MVFPNPPGGRPREHPYRELLNVMFYVVRTACQWRNLPQDFAPWRTVYLQSTKYSDQRRCDAGKKVNGRKRHMLVDTLG